MLYNNLKNKDLSEYFFLAANEKYKLISVL